LDEVERTHAVDLQRGHRATLQKDETYYPQIESAVRAEAASMAPHYEVFYSLETTIRRSVREQLAEAEEEGGSWWDDFIPEKIRSDAVSRKNREIASGFTPRSDDVMDFLTFGELAVIITGNWDIFGAVFTDKRAVERVMSDLNTLRGPIAHCSPLAPDEVVRLGLTVAAWFRLGEE
jgi:hypothetical protein